MKLLIPSQTLTVQPLKFGNEQVILSHTWMGMWLLIHVETKIRHVSSDRLASPWWCSGCFCSQTGVRTSANIVLTRTLVYTLQFHESYYALQWRHNGYDGVSNHQSRHCLLNRLFRRRSKKTSELRVTGLCAGNSPVTCEFPAQMREKCFHLMTSSW